MPNPTPDFEAAERELLAHAGGSPDGSRHPSPQLLRAYGQDVLSTQVEERIAQHLRTCALCTMLREDLATLPEPELSSFHQRRIAETLPAGRPGTLSFPKRRLVPILTGIAAALLVTATIVHFAGVHRQSPTTANSASTTPVPATPIVATLEIPVLPLAPPADNATSLQTRGVGSTTPSTELLAPAFSAYRRGDYADAAERFELLQARYPSSGLVALYLGVSQVLSHQDRSAYLTLQKARDLAPRSDSARWYSAIAAQRIQAIQAKSLFESLCTEKASPYSEQSCRIAASLN